MNKMLKYRPEIDGLRAVAVLSVLIFHAHILKPGGGILLPGGFLGVDIFFVISGYLITLIILRELREGRFSFLNFYRRRARRILPALFVVLAVSSIVFWFFLLPQEMIEFAGSIFSTNFFYSNFLFWSEDPYWAADSKLKPLLHTWSLAVEEQYYLITPALLYLGYKLLMRSVFALMVSIFAASFLLAFFYTPADRNSAFYLLPFRFWEMMAGGLLAHVEIKNGRRLTGRIRYLLMPLSLAAVVWSVSMTTQKDLHPHLITLLPVLGTAGLIWFADPGEWTTRLLKSRPLVAVGLISYPLYLWHFPMFVIFSVAGFGLSLPGKTGVLAGATLLAALTYTFIEKKVRFSGRVSDKLFIIYTLVVLLGLSGYALLGIHSEGFKGRLSELYRLYGDKEPSNRILRVKTWPFQTRRNQPAMKNEPARNILVIGDSQAKDMYNALHLNRSLLPQYSIIRREYNFTERDKSCIADKPEQLNEFVQSKAWRKSYTVVISDLFKGKAHTDCLARFLKKTDLKDKNVVLFSTTFFKLPGNTVSVFTDKIDGMRKRNRLIDIYFKRYPPGSATFLDIAILSNGGISVDEAAKMQYRAIGASSIQVNHDLKAIAKQFGLAYVDKNELLCNSQQKKCRLLTENNKKVFYDQMHLSLAGARMFGREVIMKKLIPLPD